MSTMTTPGPLARLALSRIPDRWHDSVARDLSDEAARKHLSGVRADLWLAWQILRVAARFSREDRHRARESAAGRATAWNLGNDVRLAVRSVRRAPASAMAVMCTLALGTGAVTATYAVINYAILRPMPGVADESRLVSVYTQVAATTASRASASLAHLVAMRDHTPALTGLAGWNYSEQAFALDPRQPPRMTSFVTVTRGFFDVLGVRPRLGRLFTTDEYEATGGSRLVISERLWRRAFNDDPSIVGRRVLVSGKPFEIIGVARAFQGLDRLRHDDGWLAFAGDEYAPTNMVGRLAPGATIGQAQTQLTTAFRAIGESRIGDRTFWPFAFPGLTDGIGLSTARMMAVFRVMLAGVALLLVLACANAANLMLARHLRRSADLAVRHALGASRRRLLRELLVEAGGMSIGAAVLGLGLAALLTSLFRTSRLLAYLPVLDTLSLDWRVAAFCAAVSAATIVLFALVPAMLASRADIRATAAAGMRTTRRTGWLRTALVAAQVALSFTLVVVAALLVQSVHRLQTVDFGFDTDRVLAFSFRPTRAGYDDNGTATAMQRVQERLAATPGISSVALAFLSPLGGTSGSSIRLPGQDDAHAIKISSHDVTGEYFSVLGIPVLQGRSFTPSESRQRQSDNAPIILNDTLARKLFGAEPALGREILQQGRSARGVTWRSRTIIGIVGSVVGSDVREGIKPFAYEPFGGSRIATVLVRPAGPIGNIANLVRETAQKAAPDVPVDDITPLRVEADESIAQERVLSRLSLVIGAIAGLLALAGLYAAVAQFVGERTREFAIRAAIGASRPVIAVTILRRVIRIAFGGLAVGVLLVIAVTGLLATYLFGVSARDPLTIVAVAVALTAAALASAWPAVRRAVRVDPASALRSE